MKIYILVKEDGRIDGWGSNPSGASNEVAYEIEANHLFLMTSPRNYKYENGVIVESSSIILSDAKKAKLQELNNKCNETILGRFLSSVDGVDYYFSCDENAQKNFDKADSAFDKGRMTEIRWTSYDLNGNVVRLTLDQSKFEIVYLAHLNHINSNIAKFRDDLMPKVEASTSVEQVNRIMW
jgi:YHS domain-containing protein